MCCFRAVNVLRDKGEKEKKIKIKMLRICVVVSVKLIIWLCKKKESGLY